LLCNEINDLKNADLTEKRPMTARFTTDQRSVFWNKSGTLHVPFLSAMQSAKL